MNFIDSINQRALGFVFKKEDRLVDLRLKNLKKQTLLKVDDGSLMNVAFDPSSRSDHVRIAVGHEEGQVSVHNLDHELKVKVSFRIRSHLNCIYDIAWSRDGEHIFTACGDSTVGYHDVAAETSYISPQDVKYFTVGHISMKSVALNPANPNIFASGTSDGSIFVWDTRVLSKPDLCIQKAYAKDTRRKAAPAFSNASIRSMVFQDANTLISSCAESRMVKIWDLRRTYCNLTNLPKSLYSLEAPHNVTGYSCLALDPHLMLLYARAQDSTIQIFDVGTYRKTPVSEIAAPLSQRLLSFHIKIKLSPEGQHLVAGSSSGVLNIWNTRTRQPLFAYDEEQGPAFEELTGVDWIETKTQGTLICGGCEEGELCIWSEQCEEDRKLIEDPPSLNIEFSQLQIRPKPKDTRPKTPPLPLSNDVNNVDSPTLNLPSYVENASSHPITRPSSSHKPHTPNNWLVNLRKEITPKRSTCTLGPSSADKNKSGKKSRRRLNSSPEMTLTEFMEHHCKMPRLDNENHPLNS